MRNLYLLLIIFFLALILALALTRAAGWLGRRYNVVDRPGDRKVHEVPIPRIGGLAIILSFFLVHTAGLAVGEFLGRWAVDWEFIGVFWGGAALVGGIGLVDDFRRVPARVKLLFQVLGATVVYLAGVKISVFALSGWHIAFPAGVDYLVTLFWFVLFINAVNLCDGLDGLAGGVVFFVSFVLVVMFVFSGSSDAVKGALAFACLAGAVMGFLRYNFNPATIFMGDGGSYFLGYALACLSIHYSAKSQMGAAFMIPLVAMGIPIFDVILAPIRRFLVGNQAFQPDRGHIHHMLMRYGFLPRHAVMVIYGVTLAFCVIAIIVVQTRRELVGLVLLVMFLGMFLAVRKINYVEYFAVDKLLGWFRDIIDTAGMTRDRRSFLGRQIAISRSETLDELWEEICEAARMIGLDGVALRMENNFKYPRSGVGHAEKGFPGDAATWSRRNNEDGGAEQMDSESSMRLSLPILCPEGKRLATLHIVKDLEREPIQPHTIRRIEHLRRAVKASLAGMRQ